MESDLVKRKECEVDFLFYVEDVKKWVNNQIAVTDTKDCVTEYYDKDCLLSLVGIKIYGVDRSNGVVRPGVEDCVEAQIKRLRLVGVFPEKYTLYNSDGLIILSYTLSSTTSGLGITKFVVPRGVNRLSRESAEYSGSPRGVSVIQVSLPPTLYDIEQSCFAFCNWLSEIEIPNSVRAIEKEAFLKSSLRRIKLSNNLKVLKERTFSMCLLDDIEIPDSVKIIKSQCFYYCKYLKSVKLSKNIHTIEFKAFCGCDSLKHIELPDNLCILGEGCFKQCSNLESIKIPKKVTYLRRECFYQCVNLKKVYLPVELFEIAPDCFYGCKSIKEIHMTKEQYDSKLYAWLGTYCNGNLIPDIKE